MRRSAYLVILAGSLSLPLSLAHAEPTLQQRYLDIYLKINDAEHLERQGDFRGALDDFQDCYNKLSRIHDSDPNWESALVVHRMEDCKTKILDLQPKAAAQPEPAPPQPVTSPAPTPDNATNPPPVQGPDYSNPTTSPPAAPPQSDDVNALKQELQAVRAELSLTKQKLQDSEAQNETYQAQLQTVNEQLAALKGQQSVDDRMGRLLAENKDLTDKLASARKELEGMKSNPKSKLALAQAQLKNLQDQYAASQEANSALQNTTTTLKQQLDQAQADLVAANQKLAAVPATTPEYDTLKHENEIMRDILTRELQEQAHRDMAKRLAQEEFDNLKLKSKVLQEQLDILGSPMTPPSNDQERALLESLKVPGPDVAQVPPTTMPLNDFSAPVSGTAPSTDPSMATTTPPATTDTNAASATPSPPTDTNATATDTSSTNAVSVVTPPTTDGSTNQPPVTVVMNTPSGDSTTSSPVTNVTSDPPAVTAPATDNPGATTTTATPAATTPSEPTAPTTPANMPDPTAPIPPTVPPGQSATPTTTPDPAPASPTTPPAPTGPTTTKLPPAQTTYQDTTIQQGGANAPQESDPTQYSTKARLPDDMRETAQDAADLFKNQKYDESAAKYQSIIEKYPESLYAWSNLGVVRFQQGKYDDALKALQQAVKLSPTDAFSYSNLGIVYYQLNQYENAIDALNSAKALDPNDAKTHNYLGCAESQKGWQEVAEKEFRKAIEIDPNFGDAHFNLALVYATSKPPSLELARREYNRALELGIAKDARLEKLLDQPQP
jgi:Flp pilus assembly protein TadD